MFPLPIEQPTRDTAVVPSTSASAVSLSLQSVLRPLNLEAVLLELFWAALLTLWFGKHKLCPALEIPIVRLKVKSIFHSDLALTLLSVLP